MAREIARRLAGKGALVQVNTEQNQRLASRFGVSGIPAFFALKRGKVVGRISGARPQDELFHWFENAVGLTRG